MRPQADSTQNQTLFEKLAGCNFKAIMSGPFVTPTKHALSPKSPAEPNTSRPSLIRRYQEIVQIMDAQRIVIIAP